ncbi:hypothetical protein J4216_00565 [Candidatus Woesearchaeota archaeon]|nr:hypothetical protein [Candidatus Woesearchaeota archaeon]
MVKHIVKRKGHEEHFDERKIYASSYAACLNVHMDHKKAEKCADAVANDLKKWINTKKEVTSTQIFNEVIKSLKKQNKDAAYMYETHRIID